MMAAAMVGVMLLIMLGIALLAPVWERREKRQRLERIELWRRWTKAPGCAYVLEEHD